MKARPRRSPGSFAFDRRPLGVPAFRRLWIASLVSAVGGSFSVIAVPTQLFSLTGSSASVAAAAVVSFFGLVVASLRGGALADLLDRRRLLLLAQTGLALTYVALWVQAAAGVRSLAVLLVLVACQGLSFGTIMTATGAVLPRVLPGHLLAAASGLSSLVRYAGGILGPLLAGVLIPVVGLGSLYLFDAVALLGALWAVFRLPALAPAAPARSASSSGHRSRGMLSRVGEGWGYLFRHRLLPAVLAVDLAAMIFGMPVALFPQLAHRTYGGPAGGGQVLGLLYAAYPVGVFAVGLVSGVFTRSRRPGAVMAGAAVAWGVLVVAFALAPWLWLALGALVLGGGVNFALSTCRNAVTQLSADDEFRGRTQGALTVVLVGGPQIAGVLHGLAGAALGARVAIGLGGALTVLTVLAIVRIAPRLWRFTGPDG